MCTNIPALRTYRRAWRWASLLPVVALSLKAGAALAGQAAPASGTPPGSLSSLVAEIQSRPAYRHTSWGIRVQDLETGEVLIDQAGDKSLVPGSIMKVYSTSVALDAYGPDHRFRTPVYRTGEIEGGVLDGNLVLVASGDFSLGLRDRPDGSLAFNNFPEIDHNYADTGFPGSVIIADSDPLAVLDRLAVDVRAAGISTVGGDVVIDDRLFETYDGWPDGLIAPIWVNENVIDIQTTPSTPGEPAKVTWRPQTAAITVEGAVATVASGADPKPLQVETIRPGVVRVTGEIPVDSAPALSIAQIPEPAAFARTAFIEALERAGVRVTADATGPNPADALPQPSLYSPERKLAEHVSPPLSEYIKVILKVSYNRGADLMLCLAAAKAGSRDCAAGIGQELALLTRLGIGDSGTYPFDGAGSVDQGKTSPADEVAMLTRITKEPWGEVIRNGMAVLGVDGTQATNGVGTPAAGHISIKDGSRATFGPGEYQGIILAKTQVGYIDAKSGRQLVYGIFLNNAPLAEIADFMAADHDIAAIAAAIQQAY